MEGQPNLWMLPMMVLWNNCRRELEVLSVVVPHIILFYFSATEHIPPLSHLCRLEIRSLLTSDRLRSDQFIRQLPLPACLQDALLYKDVLRSYGISESQLRLGDVYQQNAPPPLSSSGNTERQENTRTEAGSS